MAGVKQEDNVKDEPSGPAKRSRAVSGTTIPSAAGGCCILASLIMRRFLLPYSRIPGNIGKLMYAKALKYSTTCRWEKHLRDT